MTQATDPDSVTSSHTAAAASPCVPADYAPFLHRQPPVPSVRPRLYDAFVRDVLPDLTGRIAVVTGGNSGLGFWCAQALACKGATVVLACRDVARGRAAQGAIESAARAGHREALVDVIPLDLASFASVRTFARDFSARYSCLHMLVNNAGVMGVGRALTEDGWDIQLQVNHLGHFLLTAELWPALLRAPGGARVVSHTSIAHHAGRPRINAADPNEGAADGLCGLGQRIPGARPWVRYGQSKLANVLFALELDRRLQAAGLTERVQSISAHPGVAATNLHRVAGGAGSLPGWRFLSRHFAQAPEDGSLSLVLAATHPAVESGALYGPDRETHGYPVRRRPGGHATDEAMARELWVLSELATGAQFRIHGSDEA